MRSLMGSDNRHAFGTSKHSPRDHNSLHSRPSKPAAAREHMEQCFPTSISIVMKSSSLLFRICGFAVFTLLAVPGVFAQSTATGMVEGRVSNSRTGDYIEHARVTVEGTTLETFTDNGGQFRLVNVPAGDARLRVFFTGQEVQTASVHVAAGIVARHDFDL